MNRLVAFSILVVAAFALANGQNHQVYVLNSPEHVKIDSAVPLRATELADVVSSMFGFTVPNAMNTWNKLLVNDPFSFPEAVVVLEIPGLKNPGFDLDKLDHHDLFLDEPLDDVYTTVEHRMKERLDNKEYSIMHGSLTNEEFLKSQVFHPKYKLNPSEPQHLDSYNEKYKVFYDEIFNLYQLEQGIKESGLKNNVPDFHWFQLQGVKALIAVQDPNTQETTDAAKKILNEAISSLVQSYNEIYNNQVLFVAITNDNIKPLQRKKRELSEEEKNINVAESPYEYYPAIFNLLLWFTVIFVFSLIAISLSIAQMDPGRDSIIYRMTSNRMKKEN